MGHRLHRVVVAAECLAQHHFAVAGGAKTQNFQFYAALTVLFVERLEAVANHFDGVAPVAGVEAVQHVLIFVHQHQLAGGAAGVHADVDPQGIPRLGHGLFQLGQGVAGFPGIPLGIAGEIPLGGVLLHHFGGRRQPLKGNLGGDGGSPAGGQGIQLIHGQGSAQGHNGVGVVGADHLVFGEAQTLGKDLDQGGVVGEGAALKDNRRGHFQALGQAADGLLGDGVEGGQGDVGPAGALVQQGLDIGLGENAAAARNAVDLLALGGQSLKLLGGHPQQGGDLVNEGAGAAGAAAVHPHVRGGEGAVLFFPEEDDLGILAAQLHGGAGFGVEGTDGGAVGHHFLDIADLHLVGQGTAARAADCDPHGQPGELLADGAQQVTEGPPLLGVVALVAAEQNLTGLPIGQDGLDGGGTNVEAEVQTFHEFFHCFTI